MPGMHHMDDGAEAKAMDMLHFETHHWTLVAHGTVFLGEIQQTGPRGHDKFISANWVMGEASHALAGGTFSVRSMLSLDPATITGRSYPEFLQTGETAFGDPLIDAQHPHDFVMELAVRYSHPVGRKAVLDFYAAPVGEPALGPVAFMHRPSAAELPQAPLAHHLQDSTHVSNEVVTAGLSRGPLRVEASGFHGGEPNENRWNIDHGAIDSWSARLTVTPNAGWSGQFSAGRLAKPEALERGDQVRTTASVSWTHRYGSASLLWGRTHNTASHENLNGFGLESVALLRKTNYVSGRVERVDKNELSLPGSFRVMAYTAGYTRDFRLLPMLATGLGVNFTWYGMPEPLHAIYGGHPVQAMVFLRFRLRQAT